MKAWLRQHWPKLRLRTLLFGIFVFVAGLPGLGAVFLRVYENTLVRQTESELIAQGAAIAAAAGGRFSDARKPPEGLDNYSLSSVRSSSPPDTGYYRPEPPQIDLSADQIFAPRPDPRPTKLVLSPGDRTMAQQLDPVITQTSRTTLASIILLDRHGTILTGLWAGKSYAHVPEVFQALTTRVSLTRLRDNGIGRARYSFEWLSRAAAVRVHHARPIIVDGQVIGVVLLSRSSRALFRGMYEDRGKILLGVMLILAILMLLTLLLHRTIAKPIEALSLATRKVSAGRGEIPDPPTTAAIEIRALYRDFGIMADEIALRSRYLRDFAAAVSHEFKTPLAGIRGAIELIEDHHGSMSQRERKQFLGNISADADRLSSLVSRLLDLARADMARPEAGARSDLRSLLPPIADAVRSATFAVDFDLPEYLPHAALPAPTLESVILGLFENAGQAGAKSVQVKARTNGDRVELTLIDDGPGIAEADADRLFEPFFTTRRAKGGTGLGLSIARSLIEASRGTINYLPSPQGTCFRLELPVARSNV